jgi:aspartyl-tRNA(Asn)/glutamyl-tRNA(Gln) amidotransferase subunit A
MTASLPPLSELVTSTQAGRISICELISDTLGRIDAENESSRAFISVTADAAMTRARVLDDARARGEAAGLPLFGVPVAIKDCIEVAGVPNTCGSAGREEVTSSGSAPSVVALEAAGAVVVGTTNMHEWAFGPSSQNEAFGHVVNPRGPGRIPGGSSGGSAAAVATGAAAVALGTDTGGSIRLPASYCGVAGLKVTTGTVSTDGCFPLSWTMDSIGPMAPRVADLLAPLEALLSTGSRQFTDRSLPSLDRLRIGVWPGARTEGRMDDVVHRCFLRALDMLERDAATVADIDLPDLDAVKAAQLGIITSEAAAVHSGEDVDRSRYEANVQELLSLGDRVPARDYVNGIRHRQVVWRAVSEVFADFDVIVSPTTPCVAPLADQSLITWPDSSQESLLDASIRFLLLWNFVGAPCVSLPCGEPTDLPVGLQVAAPPGSDRSLVRLCSEIEQLVSPPLPVASPPN